MRPAIKAAARSRPAGWRRLLRLLPILFFVPLLFSVLQVLALRWLEPPTSMMMIERGFELRAQNRPDTLDFRWRDWDELSSALAIAVVAAEDQRFPQHQGFDTEAIREAWSRYRQGGRSLRGGSTLSQQVAKNLFLWSGRSWLRKACEAWYTVLIEALWSKQRILEVYLNIAEFGDGVYGAEAAAQRFLGTSARGLTAVQAARMAAVLPSPRRYSVAAPGAYVRRRAAWIETQVQQLGGAGYLLSAAPAE